MGAYTMKSGTELCLLATRGKDAHKLVQKHNVRSLIESPREHHSKKPDEVRNRIVELLGDLPRVELFAREEHDGWHRWGNEVTNSFSFGEEKIEQKIADNGIRLGEGQLLTENITTKN
jgi:N6-adenosine-specific RNA methylase IME4